MLTVAEFLYWHTPDIYSNFYLAKLNMQMFNVEVIQCDNCTHFEFRYTAEGPPECTLKDSKDIFLVVAVTTYYGNKLARDAIRQTWGSVTDYRGHNIQTIFVFGKDSSATNNEALMAEHRQYNDILQSNFTEKYKHLTEKSLSLLQWFTTKCSKAKYLLKVDDDTFVHVFRTVDHLISVERTDFIGGACLTPMPFRSSHHKYYASRDMYPLDYYPTYCMGPSYVLSQSSAQKLLQASKNTKYFYLEDIYITGMCRKVAALSYTHIPGFIVGPDQKTECHLQTWAKTIHRVRAPETIVLWKAVLTANKAWPNCSIQSLLKPVICFILFLIWGKILLNLLRRSSVSS